MRKLIAHGAEAKLFRFENRLVKERIKKSYRLKQIDEKIRKFRTKREAKMLQKLDFVPKVLDVDDKKKIIEMDFIDGKLVKNILDKLSTKKREEICRKIGENIAKLHNLDIIHGDLTTSNFIFNKKVYFIDFGLSFVSNRIEDKAVDLHLLKQALESKHYRHFEECFDFVLDGYKKVKDFEKIINRLGKVESRGRYKRKSL